MVVGYAMFYGGLGQLLVGIFELQKGSSFSFAVFGSYGAFWLGWALVFIENERTTSNFEGDYNDGKSAWLTQWGVLTFCFWLIATRKNICLIMVLGLLSLTFFVLAVAEGLDDGDVKKAGGYIGFLTGIAAWYTAIAELANEEFGYHVLPGLKPILNPERFQITQESIVKRIQYDSRTNTAFLQFRGIQIKSETDILSVKRGVEEAFTKALGQEDGKVHVVADYEGALIAEDIFDEYWTMVKDLELNWYLSAKRFHVSSFGTGASSGANSTHMHSIIHNWNTLHDRSQGNLKEQAP